MVLLGVSDARTTALVPAPFTSERAVTGVGASLSTSGVCGVRGVPSEKMSESLEVCRGVVKDWVRNIGCGGGSRGV